MNVDKKKRTLLSEALLDMDTIVNSMKGTTKEALSAMLNEAVKDALRDGCSESEEEDDTEIVQGGEGNHGGQDAETETTVDTETETDGNGDTETETDIDTETEDGTQDGEDAEDGAGTEGDEGWDEFDGYKVGDNTYDLTGENDFDKVVKVFKLLDDNDEVAVKHEGDTVHITDNEKGSEYIIDLGTGDSEGGENLNESDDIAGLPSFNDNETDGNASEDDFIYDDEEDPTGMDNAQTGNDIDMKDNKDMVFEIDLGYTDNYQDKDPIDGLSNQETSKSGKDWDKGTPKGTEKPWAGSTEGKGEPFEKNVNEEEVLTDDEASMEEGTNVGGAVQQRTSSKSHIPANRKEYGPKAKRHVSAGGDYEEIVAEMKRIQNENKQLKKAVLDLKKNLTEAYVTNVNLGKITKLFLENATSQEEKVDIVNRFANNAKTVEQSEMLYESVKRELEAKGNKNMPNLNNTSVTANGTQALNENKTTYKSSGWVKTLDLMQRMDSI